MRPASPNPVFSDGLILFCYLRRTTMKPRLTALLCALACLPAFAAPQEKPVSAECRAVMRDAVLLQSAVIFCPKEALAAAGSMENLSQAHDRLDAPTASCEQQYGRLSEQDGILRSIPGLTDLLGTVKMADMKTPTPALQKKAAAFCAAHRAEIVRVAGKYK